ncbi:hypothetical protein V2G26_010961 [Clonostachys chloroleuca]
MSEKKSAGEAIKLSLALGYHITTSDDHKFNPICSSNMSGNGQGTSQGDSSNTATATTVPMYGIPISGKESKQIIIVREECKSPQWATQASNPSKEVQQLR